MSLGSGHDWPQSPGRAGPAVGERREAPAVGRQNRTGARNQAGLTDGDVSGTVQGTFGDRHVLQAFTPQTWAEPTGCQALC